MADVSRTIYLSRKLSSVNEESSKHVYDGIFAAPAATKHAARIDDYREIFPPAKASLGSSIPILDLPAVDRSVGQGRAVNSGFDYAGVFGGFGDNDGIEVPSEKLFSDSKRTAKRDAQLPRIPIRRMPSKSQEFSCNYGNDQTSSPVQPRRMPSKSQEFSCNYENDQTSSAAQTRRMPSTSQEFSCNYGKDETSSPSQMRRMPSKSQEFSFNYGKDQTSSPAQTRQMPSKSQEFPVSYGKDQASIPAQTRRMPSKSQEFSCNYGNDQTSSPVQSRRIPSKSQEFSCNNGNDQTSGPVQTRMQHSKSQEFSSNFPNNQMSTSPVQTRKPFSSTSPDNQTSASELPHQTVDSVKHVSVSYNKTNQLSKDGTNGTTHIAHLHAVPGYTLLFDEAGPVRKPGFDKAKRLSMNDADFSVAAGKTSRQGKHTRAVSDLGTNQQASDHDPQTPSVSVLNSPSGYFKRSSSRRPKSSKKNREKNASGDSSPLLDEELDVNSAAAISAAAMKRAIEEAEEKMRWAKKFLKELESNGFIKPTLKDSFKVKVTCVTDHSYETYGPKRNGSVKVKATRQKKCFNEEIVLKENGNLNRKASAEIKQKLDPKITSQGQLETEAAGLNRKLNVVSAGVDTTMRSPALETFEETNAHDEMKLAEKNCTHEGGGEWEAAKHLSQLFTGVKNRFVSFMSKQPDTEKTVIQKDAPSKYESLENTEERVHEVRNVDTDQGREDNLQHTEEKVKMNHSSYSVVGESALDSIRISADMGNCETEENEVNTNGSTSSPDIEMFTSKQCGPPESVEESASSTNDVNQDTSTEIKGELLQDVREQNPEIFDGIVKIKRESQMRSIELEERQIPEIAGQPQAYDDKINGGGDEEIVKESLNNVVVTSRKIEGCNLKDIEIPKDAQMMQEDVRMVEETCMVEECCERGVGAGQDVTGEATEGLIEAVDDVSEHDEHLAANDVHEEAGLAEKINQNSKGMKFSTETTVPFEPKEDVHVEQPQSVQRVNEFIGEGICEQTPFSSEASGDESDHDEYLPAVDDILEQDELLSSNRKEEVTAHEIVSQHALDLELPSRKERLTEATSTTFEPEVNIEESRSVQMADELNEECRSEDSRSHSEAANELLEHDYYVPAADGVCEEEDSCLNRIADTSQEGKVAVEEERMTTGGSGTSEFESKEQPSSKQMVNELIGEQITDTSMAAGDRLDLDNSEKDIKEAHGASPCTDAEITECDAALKFEQKYSDEETMNFATDIGPENQVDESEAFTREANEANNGESSHKRRRWFENRKNVEVPGIFQGNERTLENAEGITAEDRVEVCADEIVNDSDGSVHMERADACSDKDQEGEGLQNSENSHRRRRWFENSSEKVQLKPIPVNEIAKELKHDVSSQIDVEKLVNERKDCADGMESSNMASDKVDSRASTEAGHRRRRWFENGGKSGSTKQEEEIKQELHETSTSEELANAHQSEVHSKEKEKEKERLAVERAIREARQRAFVDARERAAAEARLKAAAQERPGKASSDPKLTISEKASMDAKLRAERAAVERATAEARERAMLKAMSEKVTFKSRDKDPKNLNPGPSSSSGYSTAVPCTSERPNGATTESPQRRKAISERNKRTMERAAKALEEKNMRDVLVQKEQAERTRFSGVLDAEVKRWSTGKEGNLRSLLSTLQYVLGPDSGWQPIPLTDLVTTTAVRKAYKRAALCVHPDKLQQRRATVQHKYICEKVFDLLKDAWNKFNPDDR